MPVDETMWQNTDGEENGLPWWTLDLKHEAFQEDGPYYGIVHGEVISRDESEVVNLSAETGEGAQIYSFSFPAGGDGVEFLLSSENSKADDLKALKIAAELLAHLPEEKLRKQLTAKISNQISLMELAAPRKVWDRI